MTASIPSGVKIDQVKGLVYGNCTGDAIGLLTEFMIKKEAKTYYGKKSKLKFKYKVPDMHRERWEVGDWTDDSDQMVLIMRSLVENNGKVVVTDFASKLVNWMKHGFEELGDKGGMGIGQNTAAVLNASGYVDDPLKVSEKRWNIAGRYGRFPAPNGAVMRTSILGVHCYDNIDDVIRNTIEICKTTHFDPRCQASCVAVTTSIAMMLQREPKGKAKSMKFTKDMIDDIIKAAYNYSKDLLSTEELREELLFYLNVKDLSALELDEAGKIGYTYKTLGAGFWALKQTNFRKAIQAITMEAGDADTNAAVAGALLGCKLGFEEIPKAWRDGLIHKDWLNEQMRKFFLLDEEKWKNTK
ncbi:unnamed protein product [Owenia fusiformis]|uniref:Uncharacterized protein n=1 Tax=Owenia fusiformis TaxID=6347 RepID=A0A8J1T928_OWEFU|nr:unnamed protein product [Owenia fusiformis]